MGHDQLVRHRADRAEIVGVGQMHVAGAREARIAAELANDPILGRVVAAAARAEVGKGGLAPPQRLALGANPLHLPVVGPVDVHVLVVHLADQGQERDFPEDRAVPWAVDDQRQAASNFQTHVDFAGVETIALQVSQVGRLQVGATLLEKLPLVRAQPQLRHLTNGRR
jgi:hypothetical protein